MRLPSVLSAFTPALLGGSGMSLLGVEAVVTTRAGDLLIFPGYWWHQVRNGDGLNFGVGLRPIQGSCYDPSAVVLGALLPWLKPKG